MTTIDPKAFRQALGNYPTGVTVVTTTDADGTSLRKASASDSETAMVRWTRRTSPRS